MQVKATTTMAKTLMAHIPEHSSIESIKRITLDEFKYTMYVDYDIYPHENDYSYKTGNYSALKVTYKPQCYAMSRYITTNDLLRSFRESDKTFNSFIDCVFSDIEC